MSACDSHANNNIVTFSNDFSGLSEAHFHTRIKTIVHLYNLRQLLNSDILFEVLGFYVFAVKQHQYRAHVMLRLELHFYRNTKVA